MTQVKALPLMQDAKFIVVDEGVEVMRSTDLIAGWLCTWKTSLPDHPVDLLLFSDPQHVFDHWTEPFKSLRIHDFYTQDITSSTDPPDLPQILKTASKQSTIIINCLSGLILSAGLARASSFIEKLGHQSAQLICIYRRDFGLHKLPSIETLGTTYVRLDRSSHPASESEINYEVSVVHRKQGGGILKNRAVVVQDISSFEIKAERSPALQGLGKRDAVVARPQATFRLDMNSREIEQKNETPLPYLIDKSQGNQSKILYVPDDVDDLDEEDPDDDLPF